MKLKENALNLLIIILIISPLININAIRTDSIDSIRHINYTQELYTNQSIHSGIEGYPKLFHTLIYTTHLLTGKDITQSYKIDTALALSLFTLSLFLLLKTVFKQEIAIILTTLITEIPLLLPYPFNINLSLTLFSAWLGTIPNLISTSLSLIILTTLNPTTYIILLLAVLNLNNSGLIIFTFTSLLGYVTTKKKHYLLILTALILNPYRTWNLINGIIDMSMRAHNLGLGRVGLTLSLIIIITLIMYYKKKYKKLI